MKPKQNGLNLSIILLIIASFFLLIYTGYRSAVLSMTHDESASWTYFHHVNFWESLRTQIYWSSANNHILNTLLSRLSTSIFGQSDWAVRLPNVMAHLIYLASSIYLILSLTNKPIFCLVGWSLINLNPYLLDFFSLARGYGLAMGFVLLSIAFFVAFLKKTDWKWALGIFISAGLAVLSNFTQLNFMLIIWFLYALLCLKQFDFDFKKAIVWQWQPVFVSLCLIFLLWQPILWLQGAGEFNWGVDALKDTFWVLVEDSLYSQKYFSKNTTKICSYFTAILTLIALGKGLSVLFRTTQNEFTKIFGIISSILVGIIVIMVTQKYILGTKYFIHRTALIFIPIWGILIFLFFLSIFKNRPIYQKCLGLFIILISVLHFSRSMNFESCREWWYDCYTLKMLEYLETKARPNEEINFGTHWMFQQASMYYKRANKLEYFKNIPYHKEILPDAGYDYYYVFKSNYQQFLTEGYEIEKDFEFACLLRKKKEGD